MKNTLVIVAACFGLAVSVSANANEELAKKSGCLGCHNVTGAKKVGASFKDLAAKNKGNAGAEAAILEKLSTGKGHPGVKATAEEQKTLVKWVLSQ